MKIALATDHAGFDKLKELKQYLESNGYECLDYGPTTLVPDDDYPGYMFNAAAAVASGVADFAILMGGSGQGEAIAANRIKGVRCALFYGTEIAKQALDSEGTTSDDPYTILRLTREHNNANALSLAARFLSLEEMKQAVDIWLTTPFSQVDRHVRRIAQLDA